VKIDMQVEPLVREALAAAVKADGDRFARALGAFPNDNALEHATLIAVNIVSYVLFGEHEGRPSADELRQIAEKIEESETWAGVTAGEAVAVMTAALDGGYDPTTLSVQQATTLPLIVAAFLLSAGHEADEQWTDLLDRAEVAIEGAR
jgi:hypothetical protein